jgi:predicted DNA-binding transcriptional regulator AlpA
MVPKSKSRSRALRNKQQPSPDAQPLPAALHDHDARVLTVRQWSQLAGFSTRTAKRHFKAGTGPQRVQLSANRVGVTLAAHKAWVEARTRGAAA